MTARAHPGAPLPGGILRVQIDAGRDEARAVALQRRGHSAIDERSNIDKDEAEALKKLAAHLLSLTAQALSKARRAGELMEVDCDAQDEITDP